MMDAKMIAVLIVAAGFLGIGKSGETADNYASFVAKEDSNNICAVPPGTDPVQWKEHLGHHPDRYAQCLK